MFGKKKDAKPAQTADLPEICKRYNIRVSSPHGAFPEDVERVLTDLENQLNRLSKENKHLEERYTTVSKEKEALKNELTKIKLDISLMEIPDTSAEEDFHMMARASSISDKVGLAPAKTVTHVDKFEKIEKVEDNQNANRLEPVVDELTTPKKNPSSKNKFKFEIITGGSDDE